MHRGQFSRKTTSTKLGPGDFSRGYIVLHGENMDYSPSFGQVNMVRISLNGWLLSFESGLKLLVHFQGPP